jgi:uncharacterized protein YgiM (DUF1202 family)
MSILAFAGYNTLYYLDSLIKVNMHPVAAWSILGLLIGVFAGVIVAIKKMNLSKLIVLYPLGLLTGVILLMSHINSPHVATSSYDQVNFHAVFETGKTAQTGIVVAEMGANVRSGPGTNHSVVTVVSRGLRVSILDNETEQHWCKIQFIQNDQTVEGWISKRLIRPE